MTYLLNSKLGSVFLLALGFASGAMAQDGSLKTLDTLEVTATRGLDSLNVTPGAVTVVDRDTIEAQSALGGNLSDVLGKTVPGLSPSTKGLTTVGQTLRGRNLFVLIDGIPQTISLRDGLHSLNAIDPESIERIEVIRGSNGVYGFGGTGGIINIITRKTEKGAPQFRTELHGGVSTEHVSDSGQYGISQSVTGGSGAVDYQLRGSVEERNSFFDADGDRIPPDPNQQGGVADSREFDILAKLGFDLDNEKRFELTTSYYDIRQDSSYVLENGVYGEQKTRAVKGDIPGKDKGTENLNINLAYQDARLFGDTSFGAQLYYRDFMTRFGYFATFYPGGGQTKTESERIGSRLDFETPFNVMSGAKLLWGVDTLMETTSQPLEDGRTFVPDMDQNSVAPFLQAELQLDPRWTVNAGLRYEKFWFEVDDYESVFGADVEGGELDYSETVFNAGTRYQINDVWATTVSFSQGFTVPEIGRVLRQPADNTSLDQIRPEPQVVDNYELGAEAVWNQADLAMTLFYSESELGNQLGAAEAGEPIPVLRSPERIYGFEAELNVYPTAELTTGGTFTWMEGKLDSDDNGSYESYLPGNRISPLKLTGYVEHATTARWSNRLQAMVVGERDRFSDDSTGFGQGEVESYAILDLTSRWQTRYGDVTLAVNNLLNEDYFPVISQMYNFDGYYTKGPGRSVQLTYGIDW